MPELLAGSIVKCRCNMAGASALMGPLTLKPLKPTFETEPGDVPGDTYLRLERTRSPQERGLGDDHGVKWPLEYRDCTS